MLDIRLIKKSESPLVALRRVSIDKVSQQPLAVPGLRPLN
jgi:hypothetical protein